ncbi:MAG TPA: efflux RND transporter permease subunit [Pirellulales bacterium]|jgi:multidrug efflux pump subunit AcrB|nr:efflux RND transporter permease subunit [Pirellulales bacterium]
MFVTKWKAGAVMMLASCTIASLTAFSPAPSQEPTADAVASGEQSPDAGGNDGGLSQDRLFTPDGEMMVVNVYSTDPGHNQIFLYNYALVNVLPEINRIRGVGTGTILGSRGYAMRIRLSLDHMAAYNLSSDDIKNAFRGCSMIGSPEKLVMKTAQSNEYELTHIGHSNKPEQYEEIILRASEDGEILRLKDVAQVELASQFNNVSSDIDGHSTAAIVLKLAPGSNAAVVLEKVKEKLKEIKDAMFPPGMEFQVTRLDSRDMVYAVIQTPRDSTLESTSAKCHELAAIAKGVDGVTSVFSIAGYQLRTDGRDSSVATCLIHLKDRSSRKLSSRQIIETLEEKCRAMNVDLEFFEPPAVSVFVAAGGFSVRVLDKTNLNDDERPGRASEAFMNDLLKRKNLETLFHFLVDNYPQYELVINNDVAVQKGVSIASAIESRFKVVGCDGQAESKVQRLVEDFSQVSFKNDHGEMVPYSSFVQLKMKHRSNEFGR